MDLFEGFALGFLGAAFAELLGWFKLRTEARDKFPEYWKSYLYWGLTVAMMVAGGMLVVVYLRSGIEMKAVIALNVGASAPLIIGGFTSQAPQVIKVD